MVKELQRLYKKGIDTEINCNHEGFTVKFISINNKETILKWQCEDYKQLTSVVKRFESERLK